jgi:predicted permease
MDALRQDLGFAIRALFRSPAFTIVALVTIGIGTGANATVFGFVSALLLRPPPAVPEPQSLHSIHTADFSSGPYGQTSYPDFLSIRSEVRAFRTVAAEEDGAIAVVRTLEGVERVRMALVSGDYFDLLGLKPRAGRLISTADTGPGGPPVAVVGFDFWQRVFGGDPRVLGQTLVVSGTGYTIVGIAPPGFDGLRLGQPHALWTPLRPPPDRPGERGSRRLSVIARLDPGSSLEQAGAQLSALAERLAQAYPETNRGTVDDRAAPRRFSARRHTMIPPQFRSQVTMLATVLMVAVGLVLVIASANVASLLLARAVTRSREIAIRLALGARPGRVVRQLFTENLLLGAAGGIVGLLFSLWTADALPSFFPEEQARSLETPIDRLTLAFVTGVSLVSTILFGLAPALQAARSHPGLLSQGSGRPSEGRGTARMRRAVVAGQVALSVVLLVSATLLVQTVRNALDADLGFARRDAVLATVELPPAEFDATRGRAYYDDALAAVRRLPGVSAAGVVRTLPLGPRERRGFRVPGYEPRPGEDMELPFNVASAGYFRALQVPLRSGREFDERDDGDGARVAIVNDIVAERFFGGDALGRRMIDSLGTSVEIVGVVRSGQPVPSQDVTVPMVYYPLAQQYRDRVTVVAATAGPAGPMIEPVRRAIAGVDRRVAVYRTMTLAGYLDEVFAAERLTAALLTVCGGMAVLLAAVGLYGVIGYGVLRRSREIAVRIALGATPGHVLTLVLREGLGVTAGGIAAGLALAFWAAHGLAFMLFGVGPADSLTFLVVASALAGVAIVAAIGPARRALSVDPMAVLRQE